MPIPTYKGHWYLNTNYKSALKESLSDAELTQKAQYHFNVALQQNIDSDYIRKLQISTLRHHKSQASAAEYLKLIFDMHASNNEYFLKHQNIIWSNLFWKFDSAISDLEINKTTVQNNVYIKLSEKNINTTNKAFKPTQENNQKKAIPIVLVAIASHHKGDDQAAIEGHIKAYKLVEKISSSLPYNILGLVKKVCDNVESLDAKSMSLCDRLIIGNFGRTRFINN